MKNHADELNALSEEKLYLCAIRGLMESEQFRRYFSAMKKRFEATVPIMDTIKPDDAIGHATIMGVRDTYRHEIAIIETSEDRIKKIDIRLAEIGRENNSRKKGNEGVASSAPPKEKT